MNASLSPGRCPHPAHFDAIDIHPYASTPIIHAFNRDDVSVPDVGRLWRVLRVATRTGRALPRGRKSIWTTEIDWDSSPPDPTGIPLAQQARYLSVAFYKLWQQGVSHVFWYEAGDPGGAGSFSAGGLFFSDGLPKPASLAFRFPFVAIRDRRGLTTLWGRAPAAGPVTIDIKRRHRWHRLMEVIPTRGGVFYVRRRTRSHVTLQARVGTTVSYPWRS
jgi:hypothetical protein